jgi:starch synthase
VKILVLSAEAVPFAKVGGLADVAGSLPKALSSLGHDVRLVMPRYARISAERFDLTTEVGEVMVPIDSAAQPARILKGRLAGNVPVYFIDSEPYFGREGIYGYQDDGERFIFFCRAALEMLRALQWQPDVLHCNDWHTGIIPNWLKTLYKGDAFFGPMATLFTIHSLQYQGIFGWRVLEAAGLAEHGFIYHPQISDLDKVVDLMARGILFADAINTVSERYAQEIMTSEYGEKLDPILRDRRERVFGILNGIDQDVFNPASDPYLAAPFDLAHLEKRSQNKEALQRQARLPQAPAVPVIGMISRLADQKGLDLLAESIDHILDLGVQFVLMGTGDQHYHELFTRVTQSYPQSAAVFLTFDLALAQRIYAGSDVFLMPSRVEPCGLNQMIAMRYGAVPVVHETGGLADTIQDWRPETGEGNGFSFKSYDRWALFAALVRAAETYRYKDAWRKLQQAGMSADYSWGRSAQRYIEVYKRALAFKARQV